jgi:hypothetical protein
MFLPESNQNNGKNGGRAKPEDVLIQSISEFQVRGLV